MSDFSFKEEDEPQQKKPATAPAAPSMPSPQLPNLPQTGQPNPPTGGADTQAGGVRPAAAPGRMPSPPLPQRPGAPNAVRPGQPTGAAGASRPPATGTSQGSAPQQSQQAAPRQSAAARAAADPHPEIMTGELERRQMQSTAKPQVNSVQAATWHRVLDWLTPIAFWMVRAAALAGGLALAYLLYGILSGGLQGEAGQLQQTARNVQSAGTILNWALFTASVAILILIWEERVIGPAVAITGLVLYFGAPPIMMAIAQSNASRILAETLRGGGLPLIVLGGLKYLYDVMRWAMDLPNRMRNNANVGVGQMAEPRQQREAQNANMFSPCWKLPFCREVIRKQCPAYLARRACWKFGRGCYCDEEMISRIIRGESLDAIKAPTRMSRQGKPPCGRCYIFLEHQGLKYKVVSPLAIPLTLLTMYVGWPTYMAFSGGFGNSMKFLWDKLSFKGTSDVTAVANSVSQKANATVSTLSPEQIQYTAQVIFGILLGFTLLIYVSKAIEWAIYKAKL